MILEIALTAEALVKIEGSGFTVACNRCGAVGEFSMSWDAKQGSELTGMYDEHYTIQCKKCDNTLEVWDID